MGTNIGIELDDDVILAMNDEPGNQLRYIPATLSLSTVRGKMAADKRLFQSIASDSTLPIRKAAMSARVTPTRVTRRRMTCNAKKMSRNAPKNTSGSDHKNVMPSRSTSANAYI